MEPQLRSSPRHTHRTVRTLLNRITFGATALSVGLALAFIVTRGDFTGIPTGARAILFGLVLVAFVVAPFVAQRFVNARVRSQSEAFAAGLGLVVAAGLGISSYVLVLFTGQPDALDALVFFALPLWQLLIVGAGWGLGRLFTWWTTRRD